MREPSRRKPGAVVDLFVEFIAMHGGSGPRRIDVIVGCFD